MDKVESKLLTLIKKLLAKDNKIVGQAGLSSSHQVYDLVNGENEHKAASQSQVEEAGHYNLC